MAFSCQSSDLSHFSHWFLFPLYLLKENRGLRTDGGCDLALSEQFMLYSWAILRSLLVGDIKKGHIAERSWRTVERSSFGVYLLSIQLLTRPPAFYISVMDFCYFSCRAWDLGESSLLWESLLELGINLQNKRRIGGGWHLLIVPSFHSPFHP